MPPSPPSCDPQDTKPGLSPHSAESACSTTASKPASALELYDALLSHSHTDANLASALRVLSSALRLYPSSHVAVAFNGGKDATVVLHLFRAVLAHHSRGAGSAGRLQTLHLLSGSHFAAVERFAREHGRMLGVEAVDVAAHDLKTGILGFTRPRAGGGAHCAIVMGTRRDDPDGKGMGHFEPSSEGWPGFMRVNPILEWSYHEVWRFLRRFGIPYCEMYDRGYTSIGSVETTVPNPALRVVGGGGEVGYKAAWQLEDAGLERAGRLARAGDGGAKTKGKREEAQEEERG